MILACCTWYEAVFGCWPMCYHVITVIVYIKRPALRGSALPQILHVKDTNRQWAKHSYFGGGGYLTYTRRELCLYNYVEVILRKSSNSPSPSCVATSHV